MEVRWAKLRAGKETGFVQDLVPSPLSSFISFSDADGHVGITPFCSIETLHILAVCIIIYQNKT